MKYDKLPDICLTCGKEITKNNDKQIAKYCSKQCRKQRHNKQKLNP